MPIPIACPCGFSGTVPDAYAGKAGKCKKCGASLVVPAAPPAAAPAAEAVPAREPRKFPTALVAALVLAGVVVGIGSSAVVMMMSKKGEKPPAVDRPPAAPATRGEPVAAPALDEKEDVPALAAAETPEEKASPAPATGPASLSARFQVRRGSKDPIIVPDMTVILLPGMLKKGDVAANLAVIRQRAADPDVNQAVARMERLGPDGMIPTKAIADAIMATSPSRCLSDPEQRYRAAIEDRIWNGFVIAHKTAAAVADKAGIAAIPEIEPDDYLVCAFFGAPGFRCEWIIPVRFKAGSRGIVNLTIRNVSRLVGRLGPSMTEGGTEFIQSEGEGNREIKKAEDILHEAWDNERSRRMTRAMEGYHRLVKSYPNTPAAKKADDRLKAMRTRP